MATEANVAAEALRVAKLARELAEKLDAARQLAGERSAVMARFGVIAVQDLAASRLPALTSDIKELAAPVAEMLDATDQMISELGISLTTAQEVAVAFIDNVQDELLNDIEGFVKDLVDAPVKTLCEECDKVGAELTEVTAQLVNDLVEPARAGIVREIDVLRTQLRDLVENFTKSLSSAGSRSAAEDEAVRSALNQLRPAIDAVMDQFGRVKSLAATVGF